MGKRCYRGRFYVGVLAVACAAVIALCLPFALPFSGRGSGGAAPSAALVANDENEGQPPTLSEGDGGQPEPEVSADGTVVLQGEYESDVVIACIGQGNDAAVMAEALSRVAGLDAAAVSVTDADVQAGYVALPLAPGASVADAVAALDDVEGVVSAQPNYIYHLLDNGMDVAEGAQLIAASANSSLLAGTVLLDALEDVNDPYAKQEAISTYNWHLKSINAYEAWDMAKGESPSDGAPRVTVAVLDTGYKLDHEDLTDGAEGGIGGNVVATYDATANIPQPYNTGVADIDGHGTHVAGIVAAIANNEKGVAGVAYNANVLPIQVFHAKTDDNGEEKHYASSLSVKVAFDYICEHAEEYNIHVANLSLGAKISGTMDAEDKLLVSAADEAWAKGVLTVCASGNEASRESYRVYPGDFLSHGMCVIALDSQRKRAYYSNYNLDEIETYKDISAPGTDVYSTVYPAVELKKPYAADAKYGKKSGTSMATPIVAAVAALVWTANPQLEPGDVIDILHSTALDLTPENSGENTKVGFDQYTGYGEVDAKAAVERARAYLMGDSTLLVGGSLTLVPTGIASMGTWSWVSSDPAIATVDNGVVTGVAGGEVVITATSGDMSIQKTITVFDISFALAENGVAVEDLAKVEEVEVEPEETLYLWFNENPNTGLWLIDSSDDDVMTTSVPGNDDIAVKGVAGGEALLRATLKENPKLVVSMKVIVRDANNPFSLESERAEAQWPDDVWEYSGQAVEPAPTVRFTYGYGTKAHTETLESGKDYTVAYADNVELGTATATITGCGKFAGSLEHSFTIERASLANATVTATGWSWDGAAHDPKVQVALGGEDLAADGNWSYEVRKGSADGQVVSAGTVLDVGTYAVVVTGKGNYEGTVVGKFEVEKGHVSLAGATVRLSQDSFVYDTTAHAPAVVSVTLPSGMAVPASSFSVSYANNIATGTATVTVTGEGNFADSASGAFQIAHRVDATTFSDFEAGAWYLRESPGEGAFTGEGDQRTLYLDYIVAKGIMSGYDDGSGKFGVNDEMTRGQLVTVLYRAAKNKTAQTTDNNVKPRFSDTQAKTYYSAAVEWAAANGIVTGYDDGSNRFGPDDPVTREQMATIMHRYVMYCGCDASPSASLAGYSDWRSVSTWARSAMSYCVAIRAMGFGGTTLNPQDNAPRIQAAKVVAVILHDIVG